MSEYTFKLETLCVKAEQLSSLAQAISDAMLESGNNPEAYANGMALFDDLFREHVRDMNVLHKEMHAAL